MILLDGISKWYPTRMGRKYVLRDVTALLPAGKHLGLLGRNGAGKTTLLRLIGGIDFPNRGAIRTTAKISWPVGLASGFQGGLTGREGARFVCRINGVTDRDAIAEKLDYIKNFSEIGDYFDMPVKTYSSGMRARLTFSTSMAFEFDYYLLDEIMSVGDFSFRQKCTDIIENRRGRSTFIVASHNVRTIKKICDIGIILENAGISIYTDIEEAVDVYQRQKG